MSFKLGKRPATYEKDTLRWTDVKAGVTLPSIAPYIPRWGYGTDFRNWKMLGNGPCDDGSITDQSLYVFDGAGDCAWAATGHDSMEANRNAGNPVPNFTCANILDQYAQYLGLSDHTQINANNDQGSNLQEVLRWRAEKGILDTDGNAHKIGTWVSIEPGNFQDLWEGLYFFESLYIGVNFPTSAMDQFNAGKIWSYVPGSQIDGGHCVSLYGRPGQNTWTCVTWGRRQLITEGFLKQYMDEAYAFVSAERYNKVTGETLEHYTDADLEKFISLLGTVG